MATPEDPASARLGENIYGFVLRETPGAWRRAWRSEAVRLARKGKSAWSLHNEVLQPLLITVALYAVMLAVFGHIMLIFLPLQAAFGWWQLTTANFIEHYGLLRQRGADGRAQGAGGAADVVEGSDVRVGLGGSGRRRSVGADRN